METERELTCLVDRVSAGEGCEAAVTATAGCGWITFMGVLQLMYRKGFL